MKKLLNKKGFTIVELVIVIAVIAILAAVLIPTFSNVIDSANKSSDLSEAQNTLKAYTAYTSSKGQPLNDGTVFKVTKSGRTYVFYKGSLHEIQGREIGGDYGVILSIGNDSYKSNKMTINYIEDDKELPFEEATVDGVSKQVVFFYSDTKNVTFEDGSLNCQIYPGSIAYFNSNFYTLNNEGKYVSSLTITAPEDVVKTVPKNVVNVKEIAYLTITNVDTTTKLIKVVSDNNGTTTLKEFSVDKGDFVDLSLPTIGDNYELVKEIKGVSLNDNKLTITEEYTKGTNIDLKVVAKVVANA